MLDGTPVLCLLMLCFSLLSFAYLCVWLFNHFSSSMKNGFPILASSIFLGKELKIHSIEPMPQGAETSESCQQAVQLFKCSIWLQGKQVIVLFPYC